MYFFFMSAAAPVFWLILAVALFIVEALTVQLICIWFAVGALFSTLASLAGAPLWLQLLVFIVTSALVFIAGRPFLLERINTRKERTNADRVIGQPGIVLEQIDNLGQTGRVRANGLDWTARSERGDIIPVGTNVIVKFIDGVKLIVEPITAPQSEAEAGDGNAAKAPEEV